MKTPATILAVFLFVAAVALNFAPHPAQISRSEEWVNQQVPTKVGDYGIINDYKMDKLVYDTLEPFGIVCKHYGNGLKQFDAVIIASANSKSFHDPRICFTSQGLELADDRQITIPTKTHGNVPATLVRIKDSKSGAESLAVYFYKGPGGMYPAPKNLMKNLFFTSLKQVKSQEGVFYRFMTLFPAPTEEELTKFIGEYLDAAKVSSKDYL